MQRVRAKVGVLIVVVAASGLVAAGCREPRGPEAAAEAPEGAHSFPLPGSVQEIMKAKLAHAHGILEAVTLEDFRQVAANARALIKLSEQADWQVHRTLAYEQFSAEFRQVLREMIDHADKKDLPAVTQDYVTMTMTCARCHSYMRHEGLAAAADGPISEQGLVTN